MTTKTLWMRGLLGLFLALPVKKHPLKNRFCQRLANDVAFLGAAG